MHRLIGCLALSACSFTHGALGSGIDAGDGPISDVARDGVIDVPTGPLCIGTGTYEVCMAMAPAQPRELPLTIDTGTSTECEAAQPAGWITAGQPESCFVIGSSITMSAGVRVSGSRPLVLAATDSITISFVLDGASHRGGTTGPGTPVATCPAFDQTPVDNSSGAPGGAGATFMTKGGDGGDGDGGKIEGRSPNVGAAPTLLRAGCPGQPGGQGDGPPGAHGVGGGAIYLAAGNTITISSAINVSGSGAGATTETKTGGSGGGSGGMLKLYAPTINASGATLMANGGGGAAGAGELLGGNPGSDPVTTAPTTRAPGGPTGVNLGNGAGGAGYALGNAANPGQPATLNNAGGGGGGGGGGFIQSNVALLGATSSPAATVP